MLNTHISRYVALHRSLGRKFREQLASALVV